MESSSQAEIYHHFNKLTMWIFKPEILMVETLDQVFIIINSNNDDDKK